MLFLLLLLHGVSFSSAEFLTPVLDHGDAILPDLCQQETVMSCDLVQVDIAALQDSTLVLMEATFTVDTELGAVWGHAQLADGRDFIIEPNLDNCKGCHVVIEENEEAFPEDHAVVFPEDAETRSNLEWTRTASDLLEMGKTDRTTVVTYSIKLYYTPEVRDSVSDIRAMADQVIATTNQGYINSKIPLRASLHCLEETEEPESYFTAIDDVNAITLFTKYKGGDNDLRGSADAAVLIVKKAVAVCGIAYKLRDASNYGKMMVSMTQLSCALGGYTFGHELGHNMGLDHDKYSNGGRNTPYSQGYHLPGTKYRTILAYYRSQEPNNRLRLNHYSNPDVKFKNVPTGSDEADAARRMTEVRFVIANIGDESQTCTTSGTGSGSASGSGWNSGSGSGSGWNSGSGSGSGTACSVNKGEYIGAGNNTPGGAHLKSKGPLDCAQKCLDDSECKAWTLNVKSNRCWLKTTSSSRGSNKKWVWGLKSVGVNKGEYIGAGNNGEYI